MQNPSPRGAQRPGEGQTKPPAHATPSPAQARLRSPVGQQPAGTSFLPSPSYRQPGSQWR